MVVNARKFIFIALLAFALVDHLSRTTSLLFFVAISFALHLSSILIDFSSQPVVQNHQQLGVGLVQRSLAQFIAAGQKGAPDEPSQAKLKSVKKSDTKAIAPAIKKHKSSASSRVMAVQQKIKVVPHKGKLPQSKALSKVKPLPKIKPQPDIHTEANVEQHSVEELDVEKDLALSNVAVEDSNPSAGDGQVDSKPTVVAEDIAATGDSSDAVQDFHDALPRYDLNPRPKYPEVARRRGQQGIVLLEVSVQADGGVEMAAIVESSGYKSLDRAALCAVRRWQFRPATSLGFPVASRVVVPVDFILSEK